MRSVEDRIRSLGGYEASLVGKRLAFKAFGESGRLRFPPNDDAETDGVMQLFARAIWTGLRPTCSTPVGRRWRIALGDLLIPSLCARQPRCSLSTDAEATREPITPLRTPACRPRRERPGVGPHSAKLACAILCGRRLQSFERPFQVLRGSASARRRRPPSGLAVALDLDAPRLDPVQATTLMKRAHELRPYSGAARGNLDAALTVGGESIERRAA
jgi:hypothetical protein